VTGVPDPPTTDDGVVVWHRRGLRVPDQPAVARAAAKFETVCPLFVFDPRFYGADGLACDARLRFLHECLTDLADQYADRGTRLVLAHADPLDVLRAFADAGWRLLATADPVARYGRRRDDRAAEVGVEFVAEDGLRRGVADTRENWSDHAEAYLTGEPRTPVDLGRHAVASPTTVAAVEAEYDVAPDKTRVPTGGREAALDRLRVFTDGIAAYPGSISAPAEAEHATSRLSPYLRFGCLSVREAYRHVDDHATDGRGREAFTTRLFWNRHYTQKLADWPGWTERAVNPVFRGFGRSSHDPDLVDAWKRGETGFPMVDAAMRCLRETGWLNFRTRAMCASVFGYILRQPWRVGADHFYHHLIDADPAINYAQWQQQTGMTGVNTMRIYNPRKQVREQDPDGEFVHEWVPELRHVPPAHLDRPERMPLALQDDLGVSVGDDPDDDYPLPVVDYDARREAAADEFAALADRAREAAQDPEIRRRLSLSGRRSRDDGDDTTAPGDGQTALDEF
jgi:deoxyribodipyrimidine photo-lyase